MNYLKDIIAELETGSCVLIIGPDIVDFGEKTFFQVMCSDLLSNSDNSNVIDSMPHYIFANEELVIPNIKETALMRMMNDFYKKQTSLDIPLKKISLLPFTLIISLMPDRRLQEIFEAQNLDYNFAHYPREGNPIPVEKPTKNTPLIYNLLGDFEYKDAIITFDHLFTFLSGIMGDEELPLVLQNTLKTAGSFIFLGVHFEKWYVQLLLKIISSNDKENYVIQKNSANNDVCTFIARRHQLDFVPSEPIQFLDELYQECVNQNLLKKATQKLLASIFISYSSNDVEVAKKIEIRLSEEKIEVIRDESSSHAGQKIEDFINTIKNVDYVLLIVSENSLKSTWVQKEIIATLNSNKELLPFYLDKSFLNYNFWEELKILAKNKINDIGQKIIARGTESIADLEAEGNDWREYNNNLTKVKNELNRGIIKSFMPEDFDNNIASLIHQIIQK